MRLKAAAVEASEQGGLQGAPHSRSVTPPQAQSSLPSSTQLYVPSSPSCSPRSSSVPSGSPSPARPRYVGLQLGGGRRPWLHTGTPPKCHRTARSGRNHPEEARLPYKENVGMGPAG